MDEQNTINEYCFELGIIIIIHDLFASLCTVLISNEREGGAGCCS